MTKEELKALRLANLKKGQAAARERKKQKLASPDAVETPKAESAPGAPPPPLAPLGTPPPQLRPELSGTPPPMADSGGLSDQKLKEGLASVFQSGTAGLANAVNLVIKGTLYRVEFSPPSDGESALWSEFALPVLKQYMPDLQNSPVKTLVVFTAIILSGKITIVKKQMEVQDAGQP